MSMRTTDEIRIRDLEVYAYHGVFEEEQREGQRFYVDAVLSTDLRQAGSSDRLEDATDYGAVCHTIYETMREEPCRLIERAAQKTAEAILLTYPDVRAVTLEIKKPEAPIDLPFSCVSVRIERGWHSVYVALGSNMGDRQALISEAVVHLKQENCCRGIRVSDLIETAPYGGVEQEDFLNGVLQMETWLSPFQLLKLLQETERRAGRERSIRWGPRTLDMDILFYDDLILEDIELTIPHKDMANRIFVLKPLCQLAPGKRHPVLKQTVEELLTRLQTNMGSG